MSIVGTRPPTLDEWNKYELHHRARLAIKPGIVSIGEGIDVMMYLEIPTVFPACFSFLNYKVDLLPSVY